MGVQCRPELGGGNYRKRRHVDLHSDILGKSTAAIAAKLSWAHIPWPSIAQCSCGNRRNHKFVKLQSDTCRNAIATLTSKLC
jgi:hypothetical protein